MLPTDSCTLRKSITALLLLQVRPDEHFSGLEVYRAPKQSFLQAKSASRRYANAFSSARTGKHARSYCAPTNASRLRLSSRCWRSPCGSCSPRYVNRKRRPDAARSHSACASCGRIPPDIGSVLRSSASSCTRDIYQIGYHNHPRTPGPPAQVRPRGASHARGDAQHIQRA